MIDTKTVFQKFITNVVQQFHPFNRISASILEELENKLQVCRYRIGQRILWDKAMPDQIIILYEGTIRLLGYHPYTEELFSVKLLKPGEILGWASHIRGFACETPAIASTEEVICLTLPATEFLALLKREKAFASYFFNCPALVEVFDLLTADVKHQKKDIEDISDLVNAAYSDAIVTNLTKDVSSHTLDLKRVWFLSAGSLGNLPIGSRVNTEALENLPVGKLGVRLVGIRKAILFSKDLQQQQESFIDSRKELPLLELFTRLREAGLPLGIDEYRLVLKALQEGFGTSDQEALAQMCCTLWVKSPDEEHLFKYHFQQVMRNRDDVKPAVVNQEKKNQTADFSDPKAQREESEEKPPEPLNTTPTSLELMQVEDEMQVAEAIQITNRNSEEITINRFTQTDEYFPVTRRQMKQSWRHLRRFVRQGLPTELDIETTIEQVGRLGILLEPVLVPSRINKTELSLLIDHKGSMTPFHALSQRLAETALRGGRLGKTSIYYFHNYPTNYLYHDHTRQQAETVTDFIAQLRPERSAVLIFSDGGAARGGFSVERLELTQKFLEKLKQRVRYIAWLNPMSTERWFGTTAGEIARLVPMFEMSRQGFDRAIDVLRGRGSHAQLR